jgi:hypothetical protein
MMIERTVELLGRGPDMDANGCVIHDGTDSHTRHIQRARHEMSHATPMNDTST